MIVRVGVVLRRTVVGSVDWRFDNLSRSHHQSQVNSCCQSNVPSPICINWLVSFAVILLAVRINQSILRAALTRKIKLCYYTLPSGSNHLLYDCLLLHFTWKEMRWFCCMIWSKLLETVNLKSSLWSKLLTIVTFEALA